MPGVASTKVWSCQGPLAGTRVIDLATMFAGPFAASLLADFGADVIKVELPKVGDANRGMGPIVKGIPAPWTILARNKRSLSLDIRKDKGKEILLKLIATADVVVENFRPGTIENWGLGYDVMKSVNPRIILVRISGYGQTGPCRDKAGFGTPAAAFSGLTYLQGYPDRPPVSPPLALVDYMTGTFGALAAMMSLYHLKASGANEGQVADIALFESAFRMLEPLVAEYSLTGKIKERGGHIGQGAAPSGTFRCKDGKWVVMVTSTQRTFARLAEVMGRVDLLKDPRYDTNPHRSENRQAIYDMNGVPVCPINSIADIFDDPQYRARGDLIEVEHPVLGTMTMTGLVPKLSATPGAVRFSGPVHIGKNNQEILVNELGISAGELKSLESEGVI